MLLKQRAQELNVELQAEDEERQQQAKLRNARREKARSYRRFR
jgi:hypothetical protein